HLREPLDRPDPAAAAPRPGPSIRAAPGSRTLPAPQSAVLDPRADVATGQAAGGPRRLRQRDPGALRIPADRATAPVRVVLSGGPPDRSGRPGARGRSRRPAGPRRAASLPPGSAR